MPFEGLIKIMHGWRRDLGTWGSHSRNFQNPENQREKTEQNNEISKDCGTVTRCTIHIMGIPEEGKKDRTIELLVTENLPRCTRHQSADPGKSENTKQNWLQKNTYAHHCEITERQRKENIQRKKHLTYGGTNRRIIFNFS